MINLKLKGLLIVFIQVVKNLFKLKNGYFLNNPIYLPLRFNSSFIFSSTFFAAGLDPDLLLMEHQDVSLPHHPQAPAAFYINLKNIFATATQSVQNDFCADFIFLSNSQGSHSLLKTGDDRSSFDHFKIKFI